jgi:endonuclease YncB( thermonuclease family)
MIRKLLVGSAAAGVAALAVLLSVTPEPASAATCDDYPNQASAQRAKDTRDADGDGIYCEDLPCPCLRPGAGGGGGGGGGADRPKPKPRAQVITARITDVVDGDTVKVRAYGAKRKRYTVRLIGVDTPETKRPGVAVECGGRDATHSMFSLAFTTPRDTDGDGLFDYRGGDGRGVTLRTDPSQDLFDRYDRLLAYVTTRSTLVNLGRRQIRDGWGKVYVFDRPFKQVDSFRAAQRSARDADLGVWGMCGGEFHTPAD